MSQILNNQCVVPVQTVNPKDPSQGERLDAIIDTGCTMSTISRACAEKLQLQTVDRAKVHTAGGTIECPVVIAALTLPPGVVRFFRLIVSDHIMDGQLLFGMDAIGSGGLIVNGGRGTLVLPTTTV